MVFAQEKNQLLYELKITTTYFKSSFTFLKTKNTCMTKKKFSIMATKNIQIH
jgi:hypothetical protein